MRIALINAENPRLVIINEKYRRNKIVNQWAPKELTRYMIKRKMEEI